MILITIGAVSRQTGIPAATLRKWEERYGFPVPGRTEKGQRAYSLPDLDLIAEISRLIAAGQRAGEAIQCVKERSRNTPADPEKLAIAATSEVDRALEMLLQSQFASFEKYLDRRLAANGIEVFVRELAIPLIQAVGAAWQAGVLPIYAEHIFSETLQAVISREVVPPRKNRLGAPRVLLASPAAEMHTLALVLINALLWNLGISPLFLHEGLPASEIAAAAQTFDAQVIALSASVAYPPRLLRNELQTLRELVPAHVQIWVGGAGTHRIPTHMEGITVSTSIEEAVAQLNLRMPSP